MRPEVLPATGAPVKVRSALDPVIRAEVTDLIERMKKPDFVGAFAQELVSLREENAALRGQLLDLRDEGAPIPFPERVPSARIALLAEASGKSFTEYEEEFRGTVSA